MILKTKEGWDGLTYRTPNMILAALLLEQGYLIDHIESGGGTLKVCVFEVETEAEKVCMDTLIEGFWSGRKFTLDPRGFMASMDEVRTQIKSRTTK